MLPQTANQVQVKNLDTKSTPSTLPSIGSSGAGPPPAHALVTNSQTIQMIRVPHISIVTRQPPPLMVCISMYEVL